MKEDWLSNGDENLKIKEMLLSQFKCETAYLGKREKALKRLQRRVSREK